MPARTTSSRSPGSRESHTSQGQQRLTQSPRLPPPASQTRCAATTGGPSQLQLWLGTPAVAPLNPAAVCTRSQRCRHLDQLWIWPELRHLQGSQESCCKCRQ